MLIAYAWGVLVSTSMDSWATPANPLAPGTCERIDPEPSWSRARSYPSMALLLDPEGWNIGRWMTRYRPLLVRLYLKHHLGDFSMDRLNGKSHMFHDLTIDVVSIRYLFTIDVVERFIDFWMGNQGIPGSLKDFTLHKVISKEIPKMAGNTSYFRPYDPIYGMYNCIYNHL